MSDYKNGKIYQLVCNETGEIYVGSTVRSLEDRLDSHKRTNNNCYSNQIIDRNNYYIELLENYPCNNVYELERKEGEYQKSMKCVNHNIAGRTKEEYHQDNKIKINAKRAIRRLNNLEDNKEYHKQYCIKNAEWMKEKNHKIINCECGRVVKYHSLSKHKRSKRHIDLMNKLSLS
tara:strand:- start:57 stop:581 length:525 start_codon:yes stop_codon:yes gene_type:complete